MEDLVGVVFNDLTGVRFVEHGKGKGNIWLWRCVCGEEIEASVARVKRGRPMSCGCRLGRGGETKKICRHCGELSHRKNHRGHFAAVCQKCYNKQTNDFKTRNPKKFMVQCAKIRARKANVPFSLTHEDFEIPEFCPVLGVKLESGTKKYHEASPSLDRIRPQLGYVPGNVVVMSFRANRVKGDATLAELETVVSWLKEKIANETPH